MVLAILVPQWQRKTPIRGGNSATRLNTGFALGGQARLAVVNRREATAAAELAVVTDSGISMGSRAVPHTSTPVRVVVTWSNGPVLI